jgi:hypothetical protein
MDVSKASAREGVRVRIPLPALNTPLRYIVLSHLSGIPLRTGMLAVINVGGTRDNEVMYPRTTVETALRLSAIGILDREVAQVCGVSIAAIRHWRCGRRRPAHGTASQRRRECPRCHGRSMNESAYAYLLGLYLGDGYLSHGRRDVFTLWIACCDDWPGLMAAARRATCEVMPASGVFCVHKQGCTMVKSTSKHWPCLFPQHGPGRKHTRKIELEQWQVVIVQKYPGEFARGLFHSDGWRGVNRVRRRLASGDRWYEYPRYIFSNESKDILRLCGEALDQLAVAWRLSRRNAISVARREAVARLDEYDGPKY